MTESPTQHRHLAPGPSPLWERSSGDSPTEERRGSADATKKRVSMACTACKRSKRKCSGERPCDNCRTFSRECIFDETLDQRRRVAARRTAEELNYHRDLYNDLLKVLRADDRSYASKLLEMIRHEATNEELRSKIDEILSLIEGGREGSKEAIQRLEGMQSTIEARLMQPWRPGIMTIDFMCGDVPYRVPAQPWTIAKANDELVSHLVSLYFTWDYPTHAFLDRDVFLKHMINGDITSPFCSQFLANALLANACRFLDDEDLSTSWADAFLAEAERLNVSDTNTLAYLQGILLLHEMLVHPPIAKAVLTFMRYSLSGKNDLGYKMLHQAIQIGEALGLVTLIGKNKPGLDQEVLSEDMDASRRWTAWGLFHIVTVVHTSFLRGTLINKPSLPRPEKYDQKRDWRPYPKAMGSKASNLGEYFDVSCNLCEIAQDMSQSLFAVDQKSLSADQLSKIKHDVYLKLCRWNERLPVTFKIDNDPPPYILMMKMRYYCMVIVLFLYRAEDEILGTPLEGIKTPESPTSPDASLDYNKRNVVPSAARAIAALAHKQKVLYGMNRAHHSAVYTLNLALFVLVRQHGTFDILDSDFLSLASAFFSIASRSRLGRNVFVLFLHKVQERAQGKKLRSSTAVNDDIKRLFDGDCTSSPEIDWFAKGLEKLNENRYSDLEKHPLSKMLGEYETLSLGKDDIAPRRRFEKAQPA